MAERIFAYDISGNQIFDPEGALDYAIELTWETMWPKGYGVASFKVKRSDLFLDWVIRESYGIIIYDGATIVYDGRIETLSRNLTGADEYITVQCCGWYVLLEERQIRKRWIDIKAISNCRWPDGLNTSEIQTTFVYVKHSDIIQVTVATADYTRSRYDKFRVLYELPWGTIRRITLDYILRSGEGIILAINNNDNYPSTFSTIEAVQRAGWEWFVQSSNVAATGSADVSITKGATRTIELWVYINKTDLYDNKDYAHTSNLRVEANYETGHRTSVPTYTQGQLIEDVILLVNQKGAHLSTDFAQLGDPALILDPFVVEEPTYAGQVVEKIASYGDASLNTWGLAVWDRGDTSDNKPLVVFEAFSVSDYEYTIELSQAELASLTYERISSELFNNVTVQYQNERDETRYRTSADNALLADTTSITNEYQRDYYLRLGEGDATRADYIGRRFVERHKDRVTRGSIALRGYATTKSGGLIPTNRIRAGQRIKLLNTNEIFFIRHTSYDAESQTVRISPEPPQDGIQMLFNQRERKMGRLV